MLPIYQSKLQPLQLLQTQWASQLNPVLNFPPIQGSLLTNIAITTGVNTINHLLQRKLQGYIITGMYNTFAQIYATPSLSPDLTLILNSSGPTLLDLWVF